MKTIYGGLAAVIAVFAMAGAAFASTSNVSVATSATVAEVCVVNSGGTIAFGTVDTGSSGAVAGVITAPDFACTALTAVTVTDDLGLYESGAQMRMNDGGVNFINYNVSYTNALTGAGIGTSIGGPAGLNLTATIPAGALAAAATGNYSDTITFTISY